MTIAHITPYNYKEESTVQSPPYGLETQALQGVATSKTLDSNSIMTRI